MCYTEGWYEEWCPTYFCCHHDLIMLHAICTNICISAWIGSTSARSPTLVSKLIILNKFEVFKEMHFVRSKDAPHECCIQQQKVWQNFDAPKWPYIFFHQNYLKLFCRSPPLPAVPSCLGVPQEGEQGTLKLWPPSLLYQGLSTSLHPFRKKSYDVTKTAKSE